jgi:4-hydroxy-tetrahydrodipicolinate reductase
MGKLACELAIADTRFELVGCVVRPGHPKDGQLVSSVFHEAESSLCFSSTFPSVASRSEKRIVVFEATEPSASLHCIEQAAERGFAVVSGTTGFSDAQIEQMRRLASKTPILWSPNLSLGVAIFWNQAAALAKQLPTSYNIEILETHHRLKKDAPSGTAWKLAELLAKARNLPFPQSIRTHRSGNVGERPNDEIGLSVWRGGDIVGDHTVLFAGPGETLELKHRATDRRVFIYGALHAAQWLSTQNAGLYSLGDTVGQSSDSKSL